MRRFAIFARLNVSMLLYIDLRSSQLTLGKAQAMAIAWLSSGVTCVTSVWSLPLASLTQAPW